MGVDKLTVMGRVYASIYSKSKVRLVLFAPTVSGKLVPKLRVNEKKER